MVVKKTVFKVFSSRHFKLHFVVYFSLLFLSISATKEKQDERRQASKYFPTFEPAKLTFTPNGISSRFIQQ